MDTATVISGLLHTAELAGGGGGKDNPLPKACPAGTRLQLSGLQGFTPVVARQTPH